MAFIAPKSFHDAVRLVALLNLAFFGVEFAVALSIGSVSLFADSVDFLEDASVNALILIALAWSARAKARVGTALAGLLLAPVIATLWAASDKFVMPTPPEALPLTVTGLGALAVNLYCAFALARFRAESGSLSRAAFLSARNDAFANIAIMAAGGVTVFYPSAWPDLMVGAAIAALNIDAAWSVYRTARAEGAEARL